MSHYYVTLQYGMRPSAAIKAIRTVCPELSLMERKNLVVDNSSPDGKSICLKLTDQQIINLFSAVVRDSLYARQNAIETALAITEIGNTENFNSIADLTNR